MSYDSDEEKKLRESIARKTEQAKAFAADSKNLEQIKNNIELLAAAVEKLREKARYEKLSEEETGYFIKINETLQRLSQSLSDMDRLIFNDLFAKSHAYFFHVKKLAEEGNEEARMIYEKLLPLFKKAMGEDSNAPEENN